LSSWNEEAPAERCQYRVTNHNPACAAPTSNPDVRQVAGTPTPLRLINSATVLARYRIRREFELLANALGSAALLQHALLLLRPLLRGGCGVLQVQLADLRFGLLLRKSACPCCYNFWFADDLMTYCRRRRLDEGS
jgi:hypothetical protein